MINDSINVFRRRFQANQGKLTESDAAVARLHRELWLPIETHLAGIKTVLISPDSTLGTLPFAALPGREPGSFLIEDYRLVSIPFAALLTQLTQAASAESENHGLLVVGNVDYASTAKSPAETIDEPQLLATTRGKHCQKLSGVAGP